MAGIYIHIPFCKQACYYCDFHFSTNTSKIEDMVKAICNELVINRTYFKGDTLNTIYFGGGTPSLLKAEHLNTILNTIFENFNFEKETEITIEINPDDIDVSLLTFLDESPFNRISLGIQSFNDEILQSLNRAHSYKQSIYAIESLKKINISKMSFDLILATQKSNLITLTNDLNKIIEYKPEHISTYILTIEEKTVFGNWLSKAKIKDVDEFQASEQYRITTSLLSENGYQNYEISNFSLGKNNYALHNTGYWLNEKYLGVGPSAHSFNGIERRFNINHNQKYITQMLQNEPLYKLEKLSKIDSINEYIMISLRTWKGLDINNIPSYYHNHLKKLVKSFIQQGFITENNNVFHLSIEGKLISDFIISELFIENN